MIHPPPKPELPVFSRLVAWFLRRYFQLLYHQLAWTYDFVAWTVSLGQWNAWVRAVLPHIHNSFVLELGHGPGHLQIALNQRGTPCIGVDQSPQMGGQAKSPFTPPTHPARIDQRTNATSPFPIWLYPTNCCHISIRIHSRPAITDRDISRSITRWVSCCIIIGMDYWK